MQWKENGELTIKDLAGLVSLHQLCVNFTNIIQTEFQKQL